MHEYRIWADKKALHILLNDEPRIGDIIEHDGLAYEITGRRFIDGMAHWAAETSPLKSYFDSLTEGV